MFKLIPSRVLRKVLVIKTSVASEMVAGMVRDDRAGKEFHEMFLTDCRSVIDRVDRSVRLNKSMAAPIEPIEELPRLVNWPALWQIKLPVICWGPSMLMTPDASGPMRTSPSMVEQEAYCVASAWELMVAVDWEQREAVWAGER